MLSERSCPAIEEKRLIIKETGRMSVNSTETRCAELLFLERRIKQLKTSEDKIQLDRS